ncbi:MAG: PCYCGC motif-containing (lipo)protein, partial [Bacilli bacterium]
MLPDFLNQQPKEIQQVYQIAAMNYELLLSIPCYCGCGESAG